MEQAEAAASPLELINAPDLTAPLGHYSHVSIANGMAYISGQLPINHDGEPVTSSSFQDQVLQTLANLDACLASAGLHRSHLLQVRVYVTDIADWSIFDEIYSVWIGDHHPARAVAGVKELHYGAAVEVEAVALTASTSH